MSHEGDENSIKYKIYKKLFNNFYTFLLLFDRKMKQIFNSLKPSKIKITMVGLSERTVEEQLVDRLLLLNLFASHKIQYDTKAQKTVFFAENNMNEKKIKGFSYSFFRWHYGEFSRQLEADLKELRRNGFITDNLDLTLEGEEIVKRMVSVLQKNGNIIKQIDMFGSYTEHKTLDEVKNVAYTKIVKHGKQVKDLPLETPLLEKLEDSEAKEKFEIDDGWLGTFEILLNPRIKESLDIAISEEEYTPLEV